MSSMFGSTVQPQPIQPYVGTTLTKDVMDALINTAGVQNQGSNYPTLGGITPYQGQVNPNINQTMLPGVYGNPLLSGGVNPILQQMMTWGGTGGPGNQSIATLSQYGAPIGPGGQYAANTAKEGVSSRTSGEPLMDLAYGKTTGPAAFLAPFLTARPYQAPTIPRSM